MLEIDEVVPSDGGLYSCMAVSISGNASRDVAIYSKSLCLSVVNEVKVDPFFIDQQASDILFYIWWWDHMYHIYLLDKNLEIILENV